MNKKIKVISFDLDGTLVKSSYADAVWLDGLPKLFAQERNLSLQQAKDFLFSEYEAVGPDRKEWYDIEWWFHKFQLERSWKSLLKSYKHSIELFPETRPTLEQLGAAYTLICFSNAKQEFIDIQLREIHIDHFFEHTFSSLTDFNAVKKDSTTYVKICKNLHIAPGEMVHIGDNWKYDFISPQKIGVHSYFLNREKDKNGKHILHSLSEILPFLH